MSRGNIGSTGLSKMQLALIVGTPVVIGVGYYLYKKNSKSSLGDDGKPTASKKMPLKSLKDQSISLDGTESEKDIEKKKKAELESEKLSPLKEATNYKNEGNVCYRKGKYDEAILFYDKAIDKCPPENHNDLAIFYQNRAAAYEMLKKWSKVKEDCSNSIKHNSRYAKAYFRRAKASEATNDILDCLDDVTATCILEMFQNQNTILYADKILKQTGKMDAAKAIQTRVPILPSKNFIKTFFKSFVQDPCVVKEVPKSEDPKGYVRAKMAFDCGNFDDVIPACTEEIESSESESQYKSEALLMRGTFHLLSANFADAKTDLDAVINNADADVTLRANALIKRASLHIQLDDKNTGMEDFQASVKLLPNNPDVYHQRAQIYILIDQLDEALKEFEMAVKLAPDHAIAYIQKCYAAYRQSILNQDQMLLMVIMNDFKNAVEKFPDCVECYSLMAQVLSDQSQFEQADSFFEKAIKMAPDNASFYVHRGILWLQWKGDIEKAVALMRKSIEIDEKCELAYETLGTVEVQRANLDGAVELFEKAVKLAKSQTEMSHLYALRNAAIAQINVTRKLGIDLSAISQNMAH